MYDPESDEDASDSASEGEQVVDDEDDEEDDDDESLFDSDEEAQISSRSRKVTKKKLSKNKSKKAGTTKRQRSRLDEYEDEVEADEFEEGSEDENYAPMLSSRRLPRGEGSDDEVRVVIHNLSCLCVNRLTSWELGNDR